MFPFIRSGQNHLARHSERGKKTRQTEEEVGRQHQEMDRPGVRHVPEGSGEQGKIEKTGCKIISGAPTTVAVKGLIMMISSLVFLPSPVTLSVLSSPQWGAADAEIKVPSGKTTELTRSPFTAWSRSVYSYTCYAYCQGFLPWLILPFRSSHLHFFQNLYRFFLCWLWLTMVQWVTLPEADSCAECPRSINRLKKT